MLTRNENTVKIYIYKIRGGICAEVRTLRDGTADLFIAAQGKVKNMPAREAFDLAASRKRLEA